MEICAEPTIFMPEDECDSCAAFESDVQNLYRGLDAANAAIATKQVALTAGDNVTIEYDDETGETIISAEGGGGGCKTVTVDYDADVNALTLRTNESATVQQLSLNPKVLTVENGDEFVRIDTVNGVVEMSETMREAFRDALAIASDTPNGYTAVDGILSTAKTAYIDTGLTINGAYEFELEGHSADNSAAVFFDAYKDNSTRQGGILYNRSSPRYDRWWTGVSYAQASTSGINPAQPFHLVQNQNGVTITQGAVTSESTYNGTAATDSTHVLLFASQRTDLDPNYTVINSLKISLDGALVRDYIPVTRDSDGVAGLYDKVNDVFKPSDGTTAFTAI